MLSCLGLSRPNTPSFAATEVGRGSPRGCLLKGLLPGSKETRACCAGCPERHRAAGAGVGGGVAGPVLEKDRVFSVRSRAVPVCRTAGRPATAGAPHPHPGTLLPALGSPHWVTVGIQTKPPPIPCCQTLACGNCPPLSSEVLAPQQLSCPLKPDRGVRLRRRPARSPINCVTSGKSRKLVCKLSVS